MMFDMDLETDGHDTTRSADGYEVSDDLGGVGWFGGARIGGYIGLGLAAFTGYAWTDYLNHEYLDDAGPIVHLGMDITGTAAGLAVLGPTFSLTGYLVGGFIGAYTTTPDEPVESEDSECDSDEYPFSL